MGETIASMSQPEFESMIADIIDRHMKVWLTQLMDALSDYENGNADQMMQPEFVAGLEQSLQEAESGDTIDLATFRTQFSHD